MKKAPTPANEAARLADLEGYSILDSLPEPAFDDITELASFISGKPIALVSLIDSNRQWFKSKVGLGASETPRDVSFCGHAIHGDKIFVVNDATKDERFFDNPLVTGAPNVTFYAGVPLESPQGYKLGTLCVIDSKAGALTNEQTEMLTRLSRQVVAQMELRKHLVEFKAINKSLALETIAKTGFIANMSHEIRTPLNAIFGTLQILKEQKLTPADQELLAMAKTASETVLQLVNDVLDMSKIEAGRMLINLEPTDVANITDDITKMFAGRASLSHVTVRSTIHDSVKSPLLTDELRLKQILINLIGNALKFTAERGSVTVDLSVTPNGKDAIAKWVIKDTGIGMAKATLDKLGQPFEQGDTNITKKFGGTGLGLALVKRLMTLMQGSLEIESTLGKGSTFTISIPMQKHAAYAAIASDTSDDAAPLPCSTLIVDDTKTNRIVLNRMLEPWGFDRKETDSGLEALKIFRSDHPALILLDLQMPDMDGFEVIRNIRDFEASSPDIKRSYVVAVTGQVFDDDVKRCFDSGFDAHIAKPVSKEALRKVLNKRPK